MSDWFERARIAWSGLSQREQILVASASATALVVALFFGAVAPLLDYADRATSGVQQAEQQLMMMQRLRREHGEVTQRLAAVEQRIRSSGQNRNILTLLEGLAKRSGVKVESMEERQAQANDRYRETKVEVELKSVTLTQTVEYLSQIEQSKQLLSIKSLRVKTRPDKSALLDVTFSVSSFQPI